MYANKKIYIKLVIFALCLINLSCDSNLQKLDTTVYDSKTPSQLLFSHIPTEQDVIRANNFSDSNDYYRAGINYLLERNYEEANRLLKKSVELNPDNLTHVFAFNYCLINFNKLDDALNLMLKYKERNSEKEKVLYNISYLYKLNGDCIKANQYYKNSIECPVNKESELALLRANFFSSENVTSEAIKEFKNAVNANPFNKVLKLELAEILKKAENYQDSLIYFLDLYQGDKTNLDYILNIAQLYLNIGECDKSDEFYKKIDRNPENCKKLTPIPENILHPVLLNIPRRVPETKKPSQEVYTTKFTIKGPIRTNWALKCDYRGDIDLKDIININPTNKLYCTYNNELLQCSTKWTKSNLYIFPDNNHSKDTSTYILEQCGTMNENEVIIPTNDNIKSYVEERINAINASRLCNSSIITSIDLDSYWREFNARDSLEAFLYDNKGLCYKL